MFRLTAAMRCDVRLQFRHGFYYAAAFVALVLIIILRQLPAETLPVFLPVFVMGNMTMNTFYFVAGLVLLEKDDGVLEGLVVTPLRRGEYVWSKLLTLAALTVLENMLIVTAVVSLTYNIALLMVGVLLLAFFYTLYGFILVARYDSINSFIFPSIFWTMLLSLPLLQYFGLVSTPLIYLHPAMAPLTLLRGAFQPIALWQVGYGILYSVVWIALLFQLAKGAFYRFIIMKQGVKA